MTIGFGANLREIRLVVRRPRTRPGPEAGAEPPVAVVGVVEPLLLLLLPPRSRDEAQRHRHDPENRTMPALMNATEAPR